MKFYLYRIKLIIPPWNLRNSWSECRSNQEYGSCWSDGTVYVKASHLVNAVPRSNHASAPVCVALQRRREIGVEMLGPGVLASPGPDAKRTERYATRLSTDIVYARTRSHIRSLAFRSVVFFLLSCCSWCLCTRAMLMIFEMDMWLFYCNILMFSWS